MIALPYTSYSGSKPLVAALATMADMGTRSTIAVLALIATTAAADPSATTYQRAIEQWRAQHEAALKAEDGWLTVVGLDWLKEGENRVGSNPNFEVPLPKSAPERGAHHAEGGPCSFQARARSGCDAERAASDRI